jgi:hypothetical protein
VAHFCELANERFCFHIPAEVLGRGLAERVVISSILACKVCVSQAAASRATAETEPLGCSDATTSLSFAVDGLAALMQDQLRRDPFSGRHLSFGGGGAASSKCCRGTVGAYACLPSDSRRVALFGRQRLQARQPRSRRCSLRCCSKGLIDVRHCVPTGRSLQVERDTMTQAIWF